MSARILVVDDSPENLQVMAAVLKEQYKVRVAINGERALALAQTLAALPTEALVRVKRLVHAEHLPDVPAALGRESRP